MSDLIERQKAIEVADAVWCVTGDVNVAKVWDQLKDLPSAHPEIIRCKDCENWIPGYITDNDDFIPPKCGKYQQMVGHSARDYCSLAEAKEDTDE